MAGKKRKVDRPVVKQGGATRRHVVPQRKEIRTRIQPVDERPCIEVLDDSDTDGTHG